MIASQNYSETFGKDNGKRLATALVNDNLKENGLKIVRDENGKITLKTSEGMDHFVNNEKVDINRFVSSIAESNNLLAVQKKTTPFIQSETPSDIPGMSDFQKAIQRGHQSAQPSVTQ